MLDERLPQSFGGRFLVSLGALAALFLVISAVFVLGGFRSASDSAAVLLWFGVPSALLGAWAMAYGVGYRRAQRSGEDGTGTR